MPPIPCDCVPIVLTREVPVMIPGPPGANGKDGKDGEDGKDAPVVITQLVETNESLFNWLVPNVQSPADRVLVSPSIDKNVYAVWVEFLRFTGDNPAVSRQYGGSEEGGYEYSIGNVSWLVNDKQVLPFLNPSLGRSCLIRPEVEGDVKLRFRLKGGTGVLVQDSRIRVKYCRVSNAEELPEVEL